ncbi:carboxyl-terminal processing protease [Desulfatibacillum alkenivorans DSM 16219]|jgi:carboxyl-terminal processing protease|uniref:Carboxyl-terminal processing protease n=1 Tax=Desulfatibacillum alkenivorans DSM 16219 TaxID=1121393 RepID=A0A1M6F6T6_9BACT|nr:S41 family peptidase [Desulfatibacillum alkenivorans]SHI93438.1 carboxyl-terminal processing protease [Desulfatibacillum alkenivorans DSM 16219]
MTIRKRPLVFLAAATIALLIACPSPAGTDSAFEPLFPIELKHDFPQAQKTFQEAKKLILDNYYTAGISEDALYWAAVQGMLRYISPPKNPDLAKIWTAEQYEHILESLTGVQVSLGFQSTFNPREGSLDVEEVSPGSPAADILQPLDRILRINKTPLKGKSVAEVKALLAGDEGDQVELTVNRDIKIFNVTLTHEKVEAENVKATPLDNSVALLEIKRFSAGLSDKLAQELGALEEQGITRLIIDMRDNPGGVFMQALACAELFLPEKSVVLRTLKRDTQKANYISNNKNPFNFECIILVNHRTASSAEILAASLRDNGRAVIVGTRTYGKGVFEKTFTLENGCRLKFITGAMYSPGMQSWQGRGLAPDFLVEQDEKTLAALRKLPPVQRMKKDVALITAHKLLLR